jgi:acetyltransferase-like isoleucine patch superfamily enzyme
MMTIILKAFLKILDKSNRYRREHYLNGLRKRGNIAIESFNFLGTDMPFSIDKNIKELRIGTNVGCRKFCNFLMHANSSLSIGDNVFFNNSCSVNCLGSIEIGDNVIFGEGVKIYDHNHLHGHDNAGALFIEREKFKIGTIKIGKNCWIGSNVTILSNVEIGENVIIGANSLIFKSIPSNSIVKMKTDLTIDSRS